MISLRVLRYFVAAAQYKGIAGASNELHISPASISVAISNLEKTLDLQLFIRQPARKMTLTPAGEHILAEALSLLSHANDFEMRAGAVGQVVRGELRIACFINLGPMCVANLLSGFYRLYPDISIKFDLCHQQQILSGIVGGQYEIAITFDLDIPENFNWLPLAETPARIVLPARHRLAGAAAVSLRKMAAEPYILMDLPHTRDYYLSLFQALRIRPNIRFSSPSFEMVRTLVGNGLGYSLLTLEPQVSQTYDGTKVRHVPVSEDLRPLRIGCVSIGKIAERQAVRVFAEYTRAYFAGPFAGRASVSPPRSRRRVAER